MRWVIIQLLKNALFLLGNSDIRFYKQKNNIILISILPIMSIFFFKFWGHLIDQLRRRLSNKISQLRVGSHPGSYFLPCYDMTCWSRSLIKVTGQIRTLNHHVKSLALPSSHKISRLNLPTKLYKLNFFFLFLCRSVQAHDAGKYECQISTEPKLSHFVYLTVIGELV